MQSLPGSAKTFRTAATSLAAIALAGLLYGLLFIASGSDDNSSDAETSTAVENQIGDTPDPEETALIAVGAGIDQTEISNLLRQVIQTSGYTGQVRVVGMEQADDPLVSVATSSDVRDAIPLSGEYWIPVANFFHDAEGVSLAVLQRLARGEAVPWSEVGSGVAGNIRLVVPGASGELARALQIEGELPASIERQPLDAIPGLVNSLDKAVLALVPLSAVDHRVRSLAVDGVAPTLKVGDAAVYPLVSRLYAVPGDADGSAGVLRDIIIDELQTVYPATFPNVTRVLATGDVIFGRCTWTHTVNTGTTDAAFVDVAEFLTAADLTMGNMDNTLSNSITPKGCGTGTVNFVAPTNFIDGFVLAGYDVVTQGSNHVRDFGPEYVVETIEALDFYGIAHAGAGRNLAESQAATIFETNGVKFGIVSGVNIDVADNSPYWATADSAGSAPIDVASITASIQAVRDQVDYVIFAPQWGIEYVPGPSDSQVAMNEAALAAGADLVVGNHPHVPQWAVYTDPRGFTAWALGNFVYDQNWCYWTERSNILEATFGDGRLLSVRFIPVKVEDMYRPTIAQGSDRANLLALMELGSTGQISNELICATSPLRTVLAPFVP